MKETFQICSLEVVYLTIHSLVCLTSQTFYFSDFRVLLYTSTSTGMVLNGIRHNGSVEQGAGTVSGTVSLPGIIAGRFFPRQSLAVREPS